MEGDIFSLMICAAGDITSGRIYNTQSVWVLYIRCDVTCSMDHV